MWLVSDGQHMSPMATRSASVRLCWTIKCSGTGAHAVLNLVCTSIAPSSCGVAAQVTMETQKAAIMSQMMVWWYTAAMLIIHETTMVVDDGHRSGAAGILFYIGYQCVFVYKHTQNQTIVQ